ncbi:Homeobox domain [Sergentomyia squamirostris]
MSEYMPQCPMENFQNVQTALNEKIREMATTWTTDSDESWSQSTSSVSSSPQTICTSPQQYSGQTSESETSFQAASVVEADSTNVDRTPPWVSDSCGYPQPMVLPKFETIPERLSQIHHPSLEQQSAAVQPIPPSTERQLTSPTAAGTTLPEPAKKRSRTQFSTLQLLTLEKQFSQNAYITRTTRSSLARELSLSEKQIKIWFQNRRMKENKIFKVKTSGAKVQNRVAATAVKNLQRLAEKQNDQNIVSRLMSQRQVAFTQQATYATGNLGNFGTGDEVHNPRPQAQHPQFVPTPASTQFSTAPPPYPGGAQTFPHETPYEQRPPYHVDFDTPTYQYDISAQYPGYGDHPMDHHVHDHLLSSMFLSDIQNSALNWGTVFDRQLMA